ASYICFFSGCIDYLALHSFPTRRSSDLSHPGGLRGFQPFQEVTHSHEPTLWKFVCADDSQDVARSDVDLCRGPRRRGSWRRRARSEEHTSELQSREKLVCRLLLEKKKHG